MFTLDTQVTFNGKPATVTGQGVRRGDQTLVLDVKGKLVYVSGSDLYRLEKRDG